MKKIAWFTPFSKKSAIAEYSKIVVDELKKSFIVDVWTNDKIDLLSADYPVIFFESNSLYIQDLDNYDYLIYNLGNYYPFHIEIFKVMQKKSGLAILHDVIMHHFFMAQFLQYLKEPNSYIDLMAEVYGSKGFEIGKRSVEYPSESIWLTDQVEKYPLFQPVLQYASSIFVHSIYHKNIIRQFYMGLVNHAYLPYEVTNNKITKNEIKRQFGISQDLLLVISTGIVHPIKHIDKILKSLKDNCRSIKKIAYVLIGDSSEEYLSKLKKIISSSVLKEHTWILGYQPKNILQSFLQCADIAINIRYPNSEGCSLSLVEQMSHGIPVIVWDSGVYNEMPNNAVVKICNYSYLGPSLDDLVSDDKKRKEIGKNAKHFASKKFTKNSYINELISTLMSDSRISEVASHDLLAGVTKSFSDLGFDPDSGYKIFSNTIYDIARVADCHASKPNLKNNSHFKTLGIWLAFQYSIDIHREGIARFLNFLISALLDAYEIHIEIWCYAINFNSISETFYELQNNPKYKNNFKIMHEKVFSENFSSERLPQDFVCNERIDNLYELVNLFSDADAFLVGIPYLENAAAINIPLFVSMHDLIPLEQYNEFVSINSQNIRSIKLLKDSVDSFSKAGAFFFCNSSYVLNQHLFKYIRGINVNKTSVIYLPFNPLNPKSKNLESENGLKTRLGISKPYFIYPTQARPHKNLITLFKAARLLLDKGEVFQIVLTSSPKGNQSLMSDLQNYGLSECIIFAADVDDLTLYLLYKYAVATTITTTFEAGFPWQALESMFIKTPVIMSRIPVVTERLEAFSISELGLPFFDPFDYKKLASYMSKALEGRQEMLTSQKAISNTLLEYNWNEVAKKYYKIFNYELLKKTKGI